MLRSRVSLAVGFALYPLQGRGRGRNFSAFSVQTVHARPVDFTEIDREDFRNLLNEIGRFHMPFGKFGPKEYPPAGVPIIDLPPEYLAWFKERGFPKGRLGELLEIVFEVKQTGADGVFDPLRRARGGRFSLRKKRRKSVTFDDETDE